MAYITNSLTSANPAADLYTALAGALTTAGYTLVDTVVIGTRTHKVWKSPAASNTEGKDWYLDVAYTTTGAGSVWFGSFEHFDPATDLGYRGPFNSPNDAANPEATYYSRYGATGHALETNWRHISNNLSVLQTTTSNFAYWISATPDRVIGLTSVAPRSVAYCGFFDAYAPWVAKIGSGLSFPLVTGTFTSGTGASSSQVSSPVLAGVDNSFNSVTLTRFPPLPAVYNSNSFRWNFVIAHGDIPYHGTAGNALQGIGGARGLVDTGEEIFHTGVAGARIALSGVRAGSTGEYYPMLGWLKDVQLLGGTAVVRGDTATISGETWVLGTFASANPGFGLGFKAS